MPRLAVTLASAAALATLAGCGGGSQDTGTRAGGSSLGDSCASVKDAKASFSGLSADAVTPGKIQEMRSKLEEMGAQAPDSVADDYQTLIDGFTRLDEVLAAVGLSFSDFGDQQKLAAAIASASPEQMQAIQDAGAALGSGAFRSASEEIRREIKADCDVNLGG